MSNEASSIHELVCAEFQRQIEKMSEQSTSLKDGITDLLGAEREPETDYTADQLRGVSALAARVIEELRTHIAVGGEEAGASIAAKVPAMDPHLRPELFVSPRPRG